MTTGTWEQVALYAKARMKLLGKTRAQLVRDSGVSDVTLRKVLDNYQPLERPDKIAGLCAGLGWTSDSIDRILRGEHPEVIPDGSAPDFGERLEALERRFDRFERRLEAAGLVDPEPAS